MTSEVVVMNRLGIALATDSAATVFNGGRAKVYQADKLFMLSSKHPVGVMVYNNSSLLGVPWETILKLYRKKLGTKKFDKLEDYATDLISYLDQNTHLFPEEIQKIYYLNLVKNIFAGIDNEIKKRVFLSFEENGYTKQKDIPSLVIQEELEKWQNKTDDTCFDSALSTTLTTTCSAEIHKLTEQYMGTWKLESDDVYRLRELTKLIITKDEILPESLSGIVIAGFGELEYFPVMQSFELGEIFMGKLKYKKFPPEKINYKTASIVKPFAQSDMVETFLNGINPLFEIKLIREIADLVINYPEAVIDGLKGVTKKKKQDLKSKLLPISAEFYRTIMRNLEVYKNSKHLDPIQQSIAYLPKNELAHVAASLVNLNSFQKRMSIAEDETVGGPIDVAVISKGDGFVWIERKHYFRKELNHHFFRNYDTTQENTKEFIDESKNDEGAQSHNQE